MFAALLSGLFLSLTHSHSLISLKCLFFGCHSELYAFECHCSYTKFHLKFYEMSLLIEININIPIDTTINANNTIVYKQACG